MKNKEYSALYGLVLGPVALLGLAGCGGLAATEKQFGKSPYGLEMQSMVTVCMELQKSGDLPGLAGGEDHSLEFSSDEIDFSDRAKVSYPLRLNCFVRQDGERRRYAFVKEAPSADWEFVK